MEEVLILVDQHDHAVGIGEKLQVHRDGVLHRAFSIFVFDRHGRLLLQQRASDKYHSGGLWTNTCCGHPRHGESNDAAAHRRLREEMGFDCKLQKVAAITYRAQVSNDLIEHEYDHIYIGLFDGDPVPDPNEASNWAWVKTAALLKLIETQPHTFTVWFKKILDEADAGCLDLWKREAQNKL
jgi:isopentenyl-diphosphate delta-isomerase